MKKVVVALSGGQDSAVAAWLLKKQGFQVTGVFFNLWPGHQAEKEPALRQISRRLGIPVLFWDFSAPFKKKVIDDFIHQYERGLTPNPCVNCNRFIKFDYFLEKATKAGFDFIATGHYLRRGKSGQEWFLKKARDKKKDQSYFLWRLKKSALKKILFPLGGLHHQEVKKIARREKLISPDYQSSQEICFIPGFINEFLKKKIKGQKGEIREWLSGEFLGFHEGLFLFTLGQRTGLNLPAGPWYVVKKDRKNNILYVSRDEENLYTKTAELVKTNFLKKIKLPARVQVKPRYRGLSSAAFLRKRGRVYLLNFLKKQRALTPGQACVFYQGEVLIGGGIIKK